MPKTPEEKKIDRRVKERKATVSNDSDKVYYEEISHKTRIDDLYASYNFDEYREKRSNGTINESESRELDALEFEENFLNSYYDNIKKYQNMFNDFVTKEKTFSELQKKVVEIEKANEKFKSINSMMEGAGVPQLLSTDVEGYKKAETDYNKSFKNLRNCYKKDFEPMYNLYKSDEFYNQRDAYIKQKASERSLVSDKINEKKKAEEDKKKASELEERKKREAKEKAEREKKQAEQLKKEAAEKAEREKQEALELEKQKEKEADPEFQKKKVQAQNNQDLEDLKQHNQTFAFTKDEENKINNLFDTYVPKEAQAKFNNFKTDLGAKLMQKIENMTTERYNNCHNKAEESINSTKQIFESMKGSKYADRLNQIKDMKDELLNSDSKSYNGRDDMNKFASLASMANEMAKSHKKQAKPNLLSKWFNTKYNQNYNKEAQMIEEMKGILKSDKFLNKDSDFINKITDPETCDNKIDLDEMTESYLGIQEVNDDFEKKIEGEKASYETRINDMKLEMAELAKDNKDLDEYLDEKIEEEELEEEFEKEESKDLGFDEEYDFENEKEYEKFQATEDNKEVDYENLNISDDTFDRTFLNKDADERIDESLSNKEEQKEELSDSRGEKIFIPECAPTKQSNEYVENEVSGYAPEKEIDSRSI